jgi:hypothetical protein
MGRQGRGPCPECPHVQVGRQADGVGKELLAGGRAAHAAAQVDGPKHRHRIIALRAAVAKRERGRGPMLCSAGSNASRAHRAAGHKGPGRRPCPGGAWTARSSLDGRLSAICCPDTLKPLQACRQARRSPASATVPCREVHRAERKDMDMETRVPNPPLRSIV